MSREDPVKFMMRNMERRVGTPAMEEAGLIPARSDATIMFSRYPDGTLRLYKPGSILDDTPAGYSEENVVVKALVKRDNFENEEFMVTIPITRTQLDNPSAEKFLHETAYSHRHKKPEDTREPERKPAPIQRSITSGEEGPEAEGERCGALPEDISSS